MASCENNDTGAAHNASGGLYSSNWWVRSFRRWPLTQGAVLSVAKSRHKNTRSSPHAQSKKSFSGGLLIHVVAAPPQVPDALLEAGEGYLRALLFAHLPIVAALASHLQQHEQAFDADLQGQQRHCG